LSRFLLKALSGACGEILASTSLFNILGNMGACMLLEEVEVFSINISNFLSDESTQPVQGKKRHIH
jgi:hypothetical protein